MPAKRLRRIVLATKPIEKKRVFEKSWQSGVWKEIAALPKEMQAIARQRFAIFLNAEVHRRYKGIIYAVSSDPKVLETGGAFVQGINRPIVIVAAGLPRKNEKHVVWHELLEKEKGRVVAHSQRESRRPERIKTLEQFGRIAKRKNLAAMQLVKRFVETKKFLSFVKECKQNFEKYRKAVQHLQWLDGVVTGLQKANAPNDATARFEDEAIKLKQFLKKRDSTKSFDFEGNEFGLHFSPMQSSLTLGFGRDIFWKLDLLTGKQGLLEGELISKPQNIPFFRGKGQ